MAALNRALEVRRLQNEVAQQQVAIKEHAEALERRVAERTEDLQAALRAKDEFLSLVSHELRNPMTVIMGNADALHRYGDRLSQGDRFAALADLRQGTKRLMQLIENLLVMAKAEYGIQEQEPVLLAKLIREEVAWHRQFSPERALEVELPAEAPPPVVCNPTHIALILKNLIGNADKYSPPGQQIDIRLRECGPDLVISVLDRGPGVAPSETESVFQPFYRSKATSDVNGMGIGLAVCQKLVRLNGGEIWLMNRDGGGCEFSFSLPGALAPAASETDLTVPAATPV